MCAADLTYKEIQRLPHLMRYEFFLITGTIKDGGVLMTSARL